MSEKMRLTLDLDADLHRALKIMAARKRTTMRELCVTAIKQRLSLGKALGPDPVLEELWDNEDDAVYDEL
jgi:hypothetical protein